MYIKLLLYRTFKNTWFSIWRLKTVSLKYRQILDSAKILKYNFLPIMIFICNNLAIRIEHRKRINGSRRSDLVRNRINDLDEIKKKLHAMRACSITDNNLAMEIKCHYRGLTSIWSSVLLSNKRSRWNLKKCQQWQQSSNEARIPWLSLDESDDSLHRVVASNHWIVRKWYFGCLRREYLRASRLLRWKNGTILGLRGKEKAHRGGTSSVTLNNLNWQSDASRKRDYRKKEQKAWRSTNSSLERE